MMDGYVCTTKKYRMVQDPFIYLFICLIILKWQYIRTVEQTSKILSLLSYICCPTN
jgi:hypothetical protein